MNKSRQIKEEYIVLKDRVEERIKELETKLTPQQLANGKFHQQKSISSCEHIHCHHNFHHNFCHNQPYYSVHSSLYEHKSPEQPIYHAHSPKVLSHEMISEALIKSQAQQRQISEQIKLISEKIENISISQNRSHLSEQFSETAIRHNNNLNKQRKQYAAEDKNRCLSQIKKDRKSIIKSLNESSSKNITKNQPILVKKIKNKTRREYENSDDSNFIKSKDRNMLKSKSKSQSKKLKSFKSEYCLSLCPVHEKDKILTKNSQKAEIYIDSEYRNRKHQKNHLMESFKQQQRSKKKLISRIAMNAFNQYGKR